MVQQIRNRNGLMKRFFDNKCRERYDAQARQIGREIITLKLSQAEREALVEPMRQAGSGRIAEIKKEKREMIDMDFLTPRERLGELCRIYHMAEAGVCTRRETQSHDRLPSGNPPK